MELREHSPVKTDANSLLNICTVMDSIMAALSNKINKMQQNKPELTTFWPTYHYLYLGLAGKARLNHVNHNKHSRKRISITVNLKIAIQMCMSYMTTFLGIKHAASTHVMKIHDK